jgi:NADH:ubiquinone oxidoreductase subunit 6 (subunit J)
MASIDIQALFTKYAVYVGPVLAFLWMLAMYLLAGLKRLLRMRNIRILNPVIVLLVMGLSLWMGFDLAFQEKPYTDVAKGLIGTVAHPLFFSSLIVVVFALLWLIVTLIRPRRI